MSFWYYIGQGLLLAVLLAILIVAVIGVIAMATQQLNEIARQLKEKDEDHGV